MNIKIALIYFVVINLLGAIINIEDKIKAKHNNWRIKESTLWIIAILGGAPLSYITMRIIRHKTLHKSFMIVFPMLAIVDIGIFIYLMGG